MITDRLKFTVKWSFYGMSSFYFTVNSKSFFWAVYGPFKKGVPTQIFGNVRCPILRIKTNSTPQCWCGPASDIWMESRLNWKLNSTDLISTAAFNRRGNLSVTVLGADPEA